MEVAAIFLEFRKILKDGEITERAHVIAFRKTAYERGSQNPIVYLSSKLLNNSVSVERRLFENKKFKESIELSRYNDGGRQATIVKPIQAEDGRTIYISLSYSDYERHPESLGSLKRDKGKSFLPDIQVSFGSHERDKTIKPEDWYMNIDQSGFVQGNASLEELFKMAGIRESNRQTSLEGPRDRRLLEIEVRENTFILKFNDDPLSGEVEFPKELDFEGLYKELEKHIAS